MRFSHQVPRCMCRRTKAAAMMAVMRRGLRQCHVAYFGYAALGVAACRWMVGGLGWRVLAGSSGVLIR